MQAQIAVQSALHPPVVFPHDGYVICGVVLLEVAIKFLFVLDPATALRGAAAYEANNRYPDSFERVNETRNHAMIAGTHLSFSFTRPFDPCF
jgi:hypothetical protein